MKTYKIHAVFAEGLKIAVCGDECAKMIEDMVSGDFPDIEVATDVLVLFEDEPVPVCQGCDGQVVPL